MTSGPSSDESLGTRSAAARLRRIEGARSRAGRLALVYAMFAVLWIILSDHALQLLAPGLEEPEQWSITKGLAFVLTTSVLLLFMLRRTFVVDEERAMAKATIASEKSFSETMIESMPGIVYFYDARGRFLRWNSNLESVSGYSREEIVKMHPLDFISAAERPLVQERIAEVFASGESFVEASFLTKSGCVIPYHFTARRVQFENTSCLVGVGVDITERGRAEEMQRRLAAIVNSSEAAIISKTTQGIITSWNPGATKLFGYTEPEMLGQPITKLFPPELVHEEKDILERAGGGGSREHFETVRLRKDGSKVEVSVTLSPIFGSSGEVVGISKIARDITQTKQAERALKERENELRALAESMPQMVWMTGPDGQNIYLNHRWVEFTGQTAEEGRGKGFAEKLHPDDHPAAVEVWEKALAGLADYSVECRVRRVDGAYRWMLIRGLPFRNQEGEIVKWMGTCTDIHDLKEANTTLREQASLLDLAQDAIVVRDLDQRVLFWNRGAERLYGWTAEEALGCPVLELAYDDSTDFLAAMKVALETGDWVGELNHITKSGKKLTVEAHWTLVHDDKGSPTSILSICTDITSRKQMESQFLRAQRLESIGTLAGGIAHDFNNLLAPIVMGVSFLKRFETRESVLKVIRNIERSADRGKELVRQVLSFARGVEGTRITLDVGHIVREVESILMSTFPKDIRVEQRIADGLWLVDGDPTQIHQVILNLCVNSRDAMHDGGRLVISAENVVVDEQYAVMNQGVRAGRYVVLDVRDDGPGIPSDIQDRMFEPFFTTKDVGKGTGLGLSTVLGIVRGHGGYIDVYSEPGKGTSFKVFIPAQIDHATKDRLPSEPEEMQMGGDELILVVDDELSILDITKQTLEGYGYRAIVAEDGAKAIEIYADNRDHIAAVITDIMMPIMNGASLIAALRRINPEVLIIAASGLEIETEEKRNGIPGVKAFLKKPYSAQHLLMVLRTLLPVRTQP